PHQPPPLPSLASDFARLPMSFEPNLGQGAAGSSFVAHGAGYGIVLAPEGITLGLSSRPTADSAAAADVVQIHFAGQTAQTSLQGRDTLIAKTNYFRAGDTPLHLTDVPNYASVAQDLGPGLSVVYHGNGPNLQFDFVLAPGTDVSTVGMSYTGVS